MENALKIAEHRDNQPRVEAVRYPSPVSDPSHVICNEQRPL